jgi:hypothetical protein
VQIYARSQDPPQDEVSSAKVFSDTIANVYAIKMGERIVRSEAHQTFAGSEAVEAQRN